MDISNADLSLGFLVNTVAEQIREATGNALLGLDINVIELGVLWLVDLDPGHTQADYARFQRRDLTTFGRIVDRLERQKLLQRRNSEADRRANHLSLTDQGRKVLKIGKERALKVERELFSVLGKDVSTFRSVLACVLDLPK